MASLEEVQREIRTSLSELQQFFTPECHLTFVMRHDSNPECWMVITEDPDPRAVADTVLKPDGVEMGGKP